MQGGEKFECMSPSAVEQGDALSSYSSLDCQFSAMLLHFCACRWLSWLFVMALAYGAELLSGVSKDIKESTVYIK